jgi:hypothetical protein
MARTKDAVPRDAKGKVTFVMFQVEGDDETLQQGFRAMEQAFQRLGSPTPVYSLPVTTTNFLTKGEKPDAGRVEAEDAEPATESEYSVPEVIVGNGHKTTKPRKYTQPNFLSDLELTAGQESFKDYATKKDPKSDNHKYLVAARWLQLHKNIDIVTIDHIFTCFQAMKWPSQKDVGQPFRVMTKNNSYFQKNGKGWKLTHVGGDAADAIGA